jgi:hypothetical protein
MIAHGSEMKGKREDIKASRRIQAVLGEEARGLHGPTSNFPPPTWDIYFIPNICIILYY